MATDLGQLVYTLTLNDEGFSGQLNTAKAQVKEASGQMSAAQDETAASSGRLQGAFSSMAGQFVAGAAIFTIGQKALGAIKGAIDGAVQASKDWQTQQQGLQAEIKSTGDASGLSADQVIALAEGIQKTTPISREAALAGDNMLLTFKGIGEKQFPQVSQAVADMATRMNAGAIPSAQQMSQTALQLGKALNDPTNGLMMLRREGVTFSDQQKEQIKSMQSAGDTAGAQAIMIKELNSEFGGSAAANMKTYQGQIDAIKNRFNDLAGEALKRLSAALKDILEWLMKHKTIAEMLAAALGMLAVIIAGAMVVAIYNMVAGFIALNLAALPWIAAAMAIAAIAVLIITHWSDLKQWFDDFIRFVKQIFDDGINFIKSHWELLLGILLGPIGIAIAEIIKHFGQIKDAVQDVINWIKNAVTGFGSLLVNAGKDLINGLIHGIESMASAVTDKVKNIAKGIEDTAKKILKIFSPSKVFSDIGANVSLGLAQGISDNAKHAVSATNDLTTSVIGAGTSPTIPSGNMTNSNQSIIYQFGQGSVVLSTPEAVDEFFNIGNRSAQLELAGGSPLAGTTGVI